MQNAILKLNKLKTDRFFFKKKKANTNKENWKLWYPANKTHAINSFWSHKEKTNIFWIILWTVLWQDKKTMRHTSPLINNGFLPSSMRTESTSSTIAKWKDFGLFVQGKYEPSHKLTRERKKCNQCLPSHHKLLMTSGKIISKIVKTKFLAIQNKKREEVEKGRHETCSR